MSYKEGTYKLNLGISQEEKIILEDLKNEFSCKTLADTVRFCIKSMDLKNAPKNSIDYGGIMKDLEELRNDIKTLGLLARGKR